MNTRAILACLLLILASFVAYAADGETCIICELIKDSPQSNILPTMDEANHVISVYLYYENFSNAPPRTPIDKTMLFVYVVPGEGEKELLRMYTDENGRASFDFSEYAAIAEADQIAYTFKVVYCPFCHSEDPGYPCGFDECIANAAIEIPPTIAEPSDVPLAHGVTALSDGELNRQPFLPTSVSITHSPPPPPKDVTPAFCLPLILIFALLGGALYYTGRNPFAAFSLGSPRVGKHIRYTPTGRGVSISVRQVASSISSAKSEVKQIKTARAEAKAAGKTGKEVAKAGWAAGVKPSGWKQALTLGAYGMIKGGGGAIRGKGGEIIEAGGQKGLVDVIRGAKGAAKKSKEAFQTQMKFVTSSGRQELGLGGGVGKGYWKGVGEALVKTGGTLLGSSFLSLLGGGKLAEKMMNFTIDKDRTALASSLVAKDMAKADMQKLGNKLEKAIKAGEVTEIKIDGKSYYQIEKTSGKTEFNEKTKEMEVKGPVTVTTIRIDKEALKNGELSATETVSKKGYVEERTYSGGYKDGKISEIMLSGITFKQGSGGQAVAATYKIVAPEKMPGDYKLKLMEIAYGEQLKGGTNEYKEAHAFAHKFENRGVSAEILAKNFAGTQMGKEATIAALTKDLAGGQYGVDAAAASVNEVLKNAAMHAYYKTDKGFEKRVDALDDRLDKESEGFQKRNKITDNAMAMIVSSPPSAGATSDEIKGHFNYKATERIASEGQALIPQKVEKPTEAQTAGANELLKLGVELVTLKKEEAMRRVEEKVDTLGLSGEQKKDALKAAEKVYKDAKMLATEMTGAAAQASANYSKYSYTMEKVAGEVLKQDYKAEVAGQLAKAVAYAGIGGGEDGIAKAMLGSEGGKELAKTPEQKFLFNMINEGPYKEPQQPKPPDMPEYEGVRKPEALEGLDKWYEKLKVEERIIVDAELETMKDKNKAIELKARMTVLDTDMEVYKNKMGGYLQESIDWNAKKNDLFYGDKQGTAAAATMVLTSAIEKGVELPKGVYDDARVAIATRDPEKWKEAAAEAAPVVEKE
ncbi:hypothetical protein H0O02_04465, partial [Candidatus Micrarchaeota archaeon]|nr:hypothetical protein [Candidatus Micrarchaeota archaeon]